MFREDILLKSPFRIPDRKDLGSSSRSVLFWWKRLRHFFNVGRVNAFGPYTISSSVWIALAFSPLSVKKWITARILYWSEANLYMFEMWRRSNPADSRGTEGNLKRNKRDGDLLHIFVIYSSKVPAGFEVRKWIQIYGSPIFKPVNSFVKHAKRLTGIHLSPHFKSKCFNRLSGREDFTLHLSFIPSEKPKVLG
jgi:hypothetical protein